MERKLGVAWASVLLGPVEHFDIIPEKLRLDLLFGERPHPEGPTVKLEVMDTDQEAESPMAAKRPRIEWDASASSSSSSVLPPSTSSPDSFLPAVAAKKEPFNSDEALTAADMDADGSEAMAESEGADVKDTKKEAAKRRKRDRERKRKRADTTESGKVTQEVDGKVAKEEDERARGLDAADEDFFAGPKSITLEEYTQRNQRKEMVEHHST